MRVEAKGSPDDGLPRSDGWMVGGVRDIVTFYLDN